MRTVPKERSICTTARDPSCSASLALAWGEGMVV